MTELITEFEQLTISPQLKKACAAAGFITMTSIQQRAIPFILEGKDVVGQSGTGSGKTLAFGLPLLDKVKPGAGLQAMIMVPTRELCVQVGQVLAQYGRANGVRVCQVYGGVAMGPQVSDLEVCDVVVGTPGRILDHVSHRTIRFERIVMFILDEADKMFEMGFAEDVEQIIGYLPDQRQMMLFSATMPTSVEHLLKKHLYHPVRIEGELSVDVKLLRQTYYDIEMRDKFSLLAHLLKNDTSGLALVFCATRDEVDIVAYNLSKLGVAARAIHGGLSQNQRLRALDALRDARIDVLVATDVAARGLDIKNVTHVYNYDAPKTSEDYTHRIGRTARAGAAGLAITLLTQRDYDNFRRILSDNSINIEQAQVPAFERVEFNRRIEQDGYFRGGPRDARSGGFGGRGGRDSGRGGYGGGRTSSPRGESRPSYGGNREDSRPREGSYGRMEGTGSAPSTGRHSDGAYRGGSDKKDYQQRDSRPAPGGRPQSNGPRTSYRS